MRKVITVLIGLLLLMYVSITLFVPVPLFVKVQNVIYTILYPPLTYLYLKRGWKVPLLSLVFFNAGRVSRSVIDAHGHLHPRAWEHLPLLILILLIGFLLWRED